MIMQPRLNKIVANLNMCSASLTCSPLALLLRTQPADLALHPSAMKDHVKAHSKHVQSMLIKTLASNWKVWQKRSNPSKNAQKEATEHLHIGVPSHLWKVELSKDISKSEQSPAPGARQKTKFLGLLEKKAAVEVILATTWQELP